MGVIACLPFAPKQCQVFQNYWGGGEGLPLGTALVLNRLIRPSAHA